MKKLLFYIIFISQSWLSLGTFCVHMFNPDHDLIEIFTEKEIEEKEKELEKEKEQVKEYDSQKEDNLFAYKIPSNMHAYHTCVGRSHIEDFTPPPEKSL